MPAFTLYGARGSTNTDRVRLTLAEGGFTDYKLELLNLQKGEQKVGVPSLLWFLLAVSYQASRLSFTPQIRHVSPALACSHAVDSRGS